MDVKEAVKIAKDYAKDVFEGETILVEEVWFEDVAREWHVTIGLQRPEISTSLDMLSGRRLASRIHYKTVRIDDVTKVVKAGIRNHENMPVSLL